MPESLLEVAGFHDPDTGTVSYVVRDPSVRASNWRSTSELESDLASAGVVGISGIDTRALTRHLRDRGAMRVGVFSGDRLADQAELLLQVQGSPGMAGADLTDEVTTAEPYIVEPEGEHRFTVAAIDLGISAADAVALQRVASVQLGFTTPVPEPSAMLMAGLGVLVLLMRCRGERQRA